MSRIYVSVPCLRDSEIFNTISDIYNNADNPNRVDTSIAFLWEERDKDLEFQINEFLHPQVTTDFYIHSELMGVGAGRRLAYRNYKDHEYYLQIDSHTMLEKSWDTRLISYLKEAKELHGPASVLTGYLPAYKYSDGIKQFVSRRSPMYPICISDWSQLESSSGGSSSWKLNHKNMPQFITIDDFYLDQSIKFELSNKFCANFIFASKDFAENYLDFIPFDFLFFEEEFIMSVEMLNAGYTPIYPNFNIGLAHLYLQNVGPDQARNTLSPTSDDIFNSEKNIQEYLYNNREKVLSFYRYASIDENTNLCKNYIGVPSRKQ